MFERMGVMTTRYDLEERTLRYASDVRAFIRKLPAVLAKTEDTDQLSRSSGAVGANYIEANEGLGKRDFLMRMRIGLKEAKESRYWLRLIDASSSKLATEDQTRLIDEALQIIRIFSAIIQKVENKKPGS